MAAQPHPGDARGERWRQATLIVAASFPAWHVLLLLGVLPTLATALRLEEERGDVALALVGALLLLLLGAWATWLPVRTMWRATRGRAWALLGLALLYAVLIGPALAEGLDGPASGAGWLRELSGWLVMPLTFALIFTGGLVRHPAIPAALYVAALLLAAGLTLRRADVDGGGDRR